MPLFGRKRETSAQRKARSWATPEGLRVHAESIAESMRGSLHVDLDFSPASLTRLDDALGKFYEPGHEFLPMMVMEWGAYVGEVVVRNLGGRWHPAEDWTDCYVEVGKAMAYPMRRMASRVTEGPESSLAFWYEALEKQTAGSSSA
jgi:hypothetical protein